MPTIEDILKNDTAKGVALGVGAALVAFAAVPAFLTAARPMARVAIKSGLLLVEKGREVLAEAGEDLEDLVAEVRAELAAERDAYSVQTAAASEEPVVPAGDSGIGDG